jgi:hypothetical protein
MITDYDSGTWNYTVTVVRMFNLTNRTMFIILCPTITNFAFYFQIRVMGRRDDTCKTCYVVVLCLVLSSLPGKYSAQVCFRLSNVTVSETRRKNGKYSTLTS